MHLLHHIRIAREAAWVELLHLLRQLTHFFRSLGIALHHLAKLIQLTQALFIGALIISWIAIGVGWIWLLPRLTIAIVARVDVTQDETVGVPSTSITHITTWAPWLARTVSCQLAAVAIMRFSTSFASLKVLT